MELEDDHEAGKETNDAPGAGIEIVDEGEVALMKEEEADHVIDDETDPGTETGAVEIDQRNERSPRRSKRFCPTLLMSCSRKKPRKRRPRRARKE